MQFSVLPVSLLGAPCSLNARADSSHVSEVHIPAHCCPDWGMRPKPATTRPCRSAAAEAERGGTAGGGARPTHRGIAAVVKWVQANRERFRGAVHGPLICEVSIDNPLHANMLEQSVKGARPSPVTVALFMVQITRLPALLQHLELTPLHCSPDDPRHMRDVSTTSMKSSSACLSTPTVNRKSALKSPHLRA